MEVKNPGNSMNDSNEKSKKIDFTFDDTSNLVEIDGELRFDAMLLKKKKKPATESKPQVISDDQVGADVVPGLRRSYEELLDRIQSYINTNNPDLQISKKYKIIPPQLARVGSKKIAWTNFKTICSIMRRPPDHVLQFVLSELGTEGSIGGDGQLTLKGKFNTKHIESLLRKYISKRIHTSFMCWAAEYVTCFMCKSPNTSLERDSSTRLYNITCSACEASRSVTTIKSGFVATSRQDRRKLKNAL